MSKTIAILAGTRREATQYLSENKEENVEYIYADRVEKLRGVRLDDYIEVGTFYADPENKEIKEAAERRVQVSKKVVTSD